MQIEITEPIRFTHTALNPQLDDLGCAIQLANVVFNPDHMAFDLGVTYRLASAQALAFQDPNPATLVLFEHAYSSQTCCLYLDDPHFTRWSLRSPNFIPPESIDWTKHAVSYATLNLVVYPLPPQGGPILISAFILDYGSQTWLLDLDNRAYRELSL